MNSIQHGYSHNPEMASAISGNPVFSAIENELTQMREAQKMKYNYTYVVTGSVIGQQTSTFNIQIEQGTDFREKFVLGSAYSYDDTNATDFPWPNAGGNTDFAARGLTVRITDSRSSRELTSGFVPFELLFAPGYGLNFQVPLPIPYFWARNTQIRFEIFNRDNANRTHQFGIALNGFKITSPNP